MSGRLGPGENNVGTLGLMDPDKVEMSNLHRQILYSDKELGRPKVAAASEYLEKQFPKVKKRFQLPEAFGAGNAEKVLEGLRSCH